MVESGILRLLVDAVKIELELEEGEEELVGVVRDDEHKAGTSHQDVLGKWARSTAPLNPRRLIDG